MNKKEFIKSIEYKRGINMTTINKSSKFFKQRRCMQDSILLSQPSLTIQCAALDNIDNEYKRLERRYALIDRLIRPTNNFVRYQETFVALADLLSFTEYDNQTISTFFDNSIAPFVAVATLCQESKNLKQVA
jgi:hypothetical protein